MKCPHCFSDNEDGAEGCSACGRPLSAIVKPGDVIASRYEVLSVLGKGGMGVVYKARDRVLEEEVAIKVLRSDVARSPEMARRFRSEIRLARKVTHRNVCRIHEYGEHEGLRYISMELIEGQDLRQLLRQSRTSLPPDQAFEVAIQISRGLQAIHDVGIVHRDLKAANIMRDARGVVKLMDFGIAKEEGGTGGTAIGDIVGTPEYMSPEQARGQEVDARSDIYALTVVIYELFSGDVPFRGETPIVTIFKHLNEEPPTAGPGAPRFPEALVPVLRRGLAKKPSERFSTADELSEALRAARAHGVPDSASQAPLRGREEREGAESPGPPPPKPSAPGAALPGPASPSIRASPTRLARAEPLRMPATESPPTPPPVTPTPRPSTPDREDAVEPTGAETVPARPKPVPVAVVSVAPPAPLPTPDEAGGATWPPPGAAAASQPLAAELGARESRVAVDDTPPTPFRLNLDDWAKRPDTAPPTPLPPATLPPAGPPPTEALPAVRQRTQPIPKVALPVPDRKPAPASRLLVTALVGIPLLLMVVGILVVGRLMRTPGASPSPGHNPPAQVTEEVLAVPAQAPGPTAGESTSGASRQPPPVPSAVVSSPPSPLAVAPVTAVAQGTQPLPAPSLPPPTATLAPSSPPPAAATSPPRPSEAPPAAGPLQELAPASLLAQAESEWNRRAYEEAARLYDGVLRLDPSNPQAAAGSARARWAAIAVKRVFANENLTVNLPAQAAKGLAGGFDGAVGIKSSDFSCDISFEISPPSLRPEGPYEYTVRVSLASMGSKPIKLKSILATLTLDGLPSEQALDPQRKVIDPMRRAVVAEVSGSWRELMADWSLKVSATGDKGDVCHRTFKWR